MSAKLPWRKDVENAHKDGRYVLFIVEDIYGKGDAGGPRRKPVLTYFENEIMSPFYRRWADIGTHWKPVLWLDLGDKDDIARALTSDAVPTDDLNAALTVEEAYLKKLVYSENAGGVMQGDIEGAFSRLRTAMNGGVQ